MITTTGTSRPYVPRARRAAGLTAGFSAPARPRGEDGRVRTGPLAAAGWLVAATLTVAVSWSAVQVVRSAVAPQELSGALPTALPAADEPAATSPSGSARPSATAPRPGTTAPAGPAAGRAVSASGVGGTVVVRCVGGVPQLVSAIPRQGFAVDADDTPGEVTFESDEHRTEIKASCAGSVPRVVVEEKGGRGGNSGPGGDSGSGGDSGRGGNSGPGG